MPFAVVREDIRGEGRSVARVATEDAQGRILRDGGEGAGRRGADAVDGDVLEVRPRGRGVICDTIVF